MVKAAPPRAFDQLPVRYYMAVIPVPLPRNG